MPNRLREYQRPTDLSSALNQMHRADARAVPILLGPRPSADAYRDAEIAVDLSGLGLDYVAERDGRVHIGAQTPLQSLIDSPAVSRVAGGILCEAARFAAHLNLRNIATLGGLIFTRESPPESLLALMALEAIAVAQDGGSKTCSLAEYQPSADELLIEVNFANPSTVGGALARVARSPQDAAIVAAVAVVEPEVARLAVAGASPRPICKTLAGARLTQDRLAQFAESITSESSPAGDYRGSAEYRKAMAGVLARRALAEALERLTASRATR